MLDPATSEAYLKAMFGENARKAAGWLVIQDAGTTEDGKPIHLIAGVVTGDLRHDGAEGFTHEMVVGEVVIRPHRAHAGNNYRGCGVSALLTAGEVWNPDNWERQVC